MWKTVWVEKLEQPLVNQHSVIAQALPHCTSQHAAQIVLPPCGEMGMQRAQPRAHTLYNSTSGATFCSKSPAFRIRSLREPRVCWSPVLWEHLPSWGWALMGAPSWASLGKKPAAEGSKLPSPEPTHPSAWASSGVQTRFVCLAWPFD